MRLHLIISGCVQGVSFRAWVVRQAENLKLVGWVKNRDDGSVEIMAEGGKHNLVKFIAFCRRGSPAAVVDGIALHWSDPLRAKARGLLSGIGGETPHRPAKRDWCRGKTKAAFTGFEIKF